jgi:ATP-binding protein involved in chromosome partitioning
MPRPTPEAIHAALTHVIDPEINRPITDLDMVGDIDITDSGAVTVEILLTVAACPLKETLEQRVRDAIGGVEGVTDVTVNLGAMTEEQRRELATKLRGGPEPVIPFAKADSPTRVFAVASGKGGVGKSSITANLAVALAQQGLRVGVVDADIYGFSIPRMLGADSEPTGLEDMILPVVAHGVKAFSMGMLVPPGQPIVWRGPMAHRALQQFLTDVFWDELDVLLLDLPPGTGDLPLSVAQLLPNSELIIVTTPQVAAAEVAQRAGALALQTKQRIVGVVENMSWLELPDGSRMEVFGAGGGAQLAENLSSALGAKVPLLAQIPLDPGLREAADAGTPVVITAPDAPASVALGELAKVIAGRARTLAGRKLGVSPV